jgi:hypothetical protein
MLLQSASPAAANPARGRGLRRAREQRAPCEPVAWTPLPDPVDAVHLLALLTRVRATRVAAGEIQLERLYDVRAFKSAYAELGYLRTLTRRKSGGTIATSMPQLVQGLARLHPRWKIDGDKFADRDRHHSAVRRRLRDLHAMGLLSWRVGVDADGEDARTELELRLAPDVSADELAAAAAQLQRWQARYGDALNTGSSTGIRNAAGHGRPLSASERQRRGIARGRARAQHRREPSTTNSGPHFVASATPKNTNSPTNLIDDDHVCGLRTRAPATGDATPRPHERPAPAADNPAAKTASLRDGAQPVAVEPPSLDLHAVLQRVAQREAERQPVLDVIASQAAQRALEVVLWRLDRGWPIKRILEAWVVWRHGPMHLAEYSSSAAGPLEHDDPARLRRAATRYERHVIARPDGFPEGALGALATIAAIAAARDSKPVTLHYAIRLLDQLSRRMRASATTNDPARRKQQIKRARGRRERRFSVAPETPFTFRTRPAAPWPLWVALDAAGDPILVDGELVLDSIYGSFAPKRADPEYTLTLRDAQLLSGWQPLDGRAQMADSDASRGGLTRRRAQPGPYQLALAIRGPRDPEDVELARLAAITLQEAKRIPLADRARILQQLRNGRSLRDARDRAQWWQRLDEEAGDRQRGDDA